MLKTIRLLGIIALIAIMAFSITGCDDLLEALGFPKITTTSLPGGVVTVAYNATLTATGDVPITWSLDLGTLPAGLELNEETGVISGMPTATGTSSFTVSAVNEMGIDFKKLSITIVKAAPTITTTTLPSGTVNVAYSQKLAATGAGTITWSIVSGTLPTGLSFAQNGTISGTPKSEGTYTFIVRATNPQGNEMKQLSITINRNAAIVNLPTTYYGTWVSTTGDYQPYTLNITANTIRWGDKDGDYIQYTDVRFTSAVNTNSTHRTQYPSGYTFTGTKTDEYYSSYTFGFIALSTDGQSVYLGTDAASAFAPHSSTPIFTKPVSGGGVLTGRNSSFVGTWKPVENGVEQNGFYKFSADGAYEMSAYEGDSMLKGTWATSGTNSGNYELKPTQINGAVIKTMFGDFENTFTPKLESRWYTAEAYITLVTGHLDGLEAALEAEKAVRYAEIDADNTKTAEEKASAKVGVDTELGLRYALAEALLPMMTLMFLIDTPDIYDSDPALNGTATYAFTNSNNTLNFTTIRKNRNSETGVITTNTGTTVLKKQL